MMVKRVVATDAALALIKELEAKHGAIMFVQSAGCCDGSAPICYKQGDFYIGSRDLLIGTIGNVPYYMHKTNFAYYEHTQIILDVVKGMGASFSLESTGEYAFHIRSRVYTEEERQQLEPIQ